MKEYLKKRLDELDENLKLIVTARDTLLTELNKQNINYDRTQVCITEVSTILKEFERLEQDTSEDEESPTCYNSYNGFNSDDDDCT